MKLAGATLSNTITKFCCFLSKIVGTTLPPPYSFLNGWNGISSLKIWGIDLMKACDVLPILLPFINFSRDYHLLDIRWYVLYLVVYPVHHPVPRHSCAFCQQSEKQNQAIDPWSLPELFWIYASFQSLQLLFWSCFSESVNSVVLHWLRN